MAPAKYVASRLPELLRKTDCLPTNLPGVQRIRVPGGQCRQFRRDVLARERAACPPVGAKCIGENGPTAVVVVAAVPAQRFARRLLLPVAELSRFRAYLFITGRITEIAPAVVHRWRQPERPVSRQVQSGRRRAESGLRTVLAPPMPHAHRFAAPVFDSAPDLRGIVGRFHMRDLPQIVRRHSRPPCGRAQYQDNALVGLHRQPYRRPVIRAGETVPWCNLAVPAVPDLRFAAHTQGKSQLSSHRLDIVEEVDVQFADPLMRVEDVPARSNHIPVDRVRDCSCDIDAPLRGMRRARRLLTWQEDTLSAVLVALPVDTSQRLAVRLSPVDGLVAGRDAEDVLQQRAYFRILAAVLLRCARQPPEGHDRAATVIELPQLCQRLAADRRHRRQKHSPEPDTGDLQGPVAHNCLA